VSHKKIDATGGNNNYYIAEVPNPKRLAPYTAECEDIIEALGMTFAEGCAFKAIWRSCAARTLGKIKPGQDKSGIYDAEKVVYYGNRMIAARKNSIQEEDTASSVSFSSKMKMKIEVNYAHCSREFGSPDCGCINPEPCDKSIESCLARSNEQNFNGILIL